jgi:hypothetical protein
MKPEIELFRIISMFGIVWFHSGINYGKEVAYGGLIFFIIISVYFAVSSTRTHTFTQRVKRLIIPCVVWSIFYGVISVLRKGAVFPTDYNYFSMVLATPSIHLWYLPFIFLILLVIDKLKYYILKEWVTVFSGISAIVILMLSPMWRAINFITPIGQYAHAIPAVLIGVFLGGVKVRKWLRISVIAGIVLSILAMVYSRQSGIGIPYLIGLTPCIFIYYETIFIKSNKYLLALSSSIFGVYLAHLFLITVLRYAGVSGYSLAVFAFVISLASILVLRKYFPKNIVKLVA